MKQQSVSEEDLGVFAMRFRKQAGISRAQAARDMGVSQTSIFHAEASTRKGLTKLRIRMIEKYSEFSVRGPVYLLKAK